MDLVEIDVIGAQPAQALLARRQDPPARVPLSIGIMPHGTVHLGGQNDLFPLGLCQGLSDDLLGLTRGVDVGGVDEVDAGIEGPVNDADRLVMIGGSPGPEHHGPQAQRADFDTGTTKSTEFHGPIVAAYPVRGPRSWYGGQVLSGEPVGKTRTGQAHPRRREQGAASHRLAGPTRYPDRD